MEKLFPPGCERAATLIKRLTDFSTEPVHDSGGPVHSNDKALISTTEIKAVEVSDGTATSDLISLKDTIFGCGWTRSMFSSLLALACRKSWLFSV
jgi:hypothetical protein